MCSTEIVCNLDERRSFIDISFKSLKIVLLHNVSLCPSHPQANSQHHGEHFNNIKTLSGVLKCNEFGGEVAEGFKIKQLLMDLQGDFESSAISAVFKTLETPRRTVASANGVWELDLNKQSTAFKCQSIFVESQVKSLGNAKNLPSRPEISSKYQEDVSNYNSLSFSGRIQLGFIISIQVQANSKATDGQVNDAEHLEHRSLTTESLFRKADGVHRRLLY
uniref:Uncharacterized protein n=1 Tax=Parascaris equorum TaxID=6256 RepID=A0A914RAG2_PAREQ